jgi:dTDP-4-amino-4,6-dideoxygalactose transaminase
MDTICDIAKKHGLLVVEDAAQAFLSTYKGRQLGTIGDLGCFSFHYTKNIICGEGGALAINRSAERARRALILWEKGTNRCDFLSGKVDKYQWVDIGSSHVPSEVSCAILWAQLQQCDEITARRKTNFEIYHAGLVGLTAAAAAARKMKTGKRDDTGTGAALLQIPIVPKECVSNAHIFFIVLPSREVREQVQRRLNEADISVFSHYVPLHSSPAGLIHGRVGAQSEAMTVTNATFDGLLRLPVWVGLSTEDLDKVINAVTLAVEELC